MKDFSYFRASSTDEARQRAAQPDAMLLAGGTTLLDLAKCGVAEPSSVVDISHLSSLSQIWADAGGVTIGALAKMEDVARSPGIRADYPAISQSLLLAASPQLRNMATIGGNLLQRTRCPYFRDPGTFFACNKRNPGSGCSAIGGVTRNQAVLGTSEACIACYPGDLAVALVALEATIDLGDRKVAADDFFVLPGSTPERETLLERGEMVMAVNIPASAVARNSTYLKVRDRKSYEFAAASAAVGLELEADGKTIRDIRVALGGVATKPWRARSVEKALLGKVLDAGTVGAASRLAVEGAVAHGGNSYKIELAPRVVARAILTMGGIA
ncbi:FAD-binding molybdopterin dehydrogenase [Rhizobium sp. R72]|uniref:FAD binding domain-containing protein n=1 Tax=unclassified Rhizobium TaxID=2613769 RepID=UPI000B5378D2|nr:MULTISPECIES: xanthine dehydrogenase family protein subunit M [unclassified Rhizobium]OWW04856.1 FAD-binding molybdopterin dehydrogenase [Rhizobium sp. R72]OWW05913.1 FAD-binding molybdopterin dehydrogenase [Rhizobium sp. R711]